jgi:glyoxylase-like metal-dependent hydrolase (beta-lactamase superfamily II)
MIAGMASRWIGMLMMCGALVLTVAARPSTQNRPTANAPLQLQPRNACARSTRIVLLGTGTPSPDPDRSGPATAVVVNGTPYLIDFGPGVVRRIAAASQKGVAGLGVVNVRVAFLTHLHSDHTAGYPDLILTPWSVGRSQPLEVYGPAGSST